MASCTSGLTNIKKTMKMYVIDYLFVLICIYSFYPVLHVALISPISPQDFVMPGIVQHLAQPYIDPYLKWHRATFVEENVS